MPYREYILMRNIKLGALFRRIRHARPPHFRGHALRGSSRRNARSRHDRKG